MDDEIEEALEKINEEEYPEMLAFACELLAMSKGDGRTPTNVMYDLLESTSFQSMKDQMCRDYDKR